MTRVGTRSLLLSLVSAMLPASASAELILSQVIVDLEFDEPAREDIEAFNNSAERIYLAVDPFQIENPGTDHQQRLPATNPQESGLLVTPQRVILEPGERRLIRVAAVAPRPQQDRIYRISIRPVAGEISSSADALKVFVGYDALVIYRPAAISGGLEAIRTDQTLIITNKSNTSHELFDGRRCDLSGENCQDLPPKRVYPGAVWEQQVPRDTVVTYKTATGRNISTVTF